MKKRTSLLIVVLCVCYQIRVGAQVANPPIFLDPNNVFGNVSYSMGPEGNVLVTFSINQKNINSNPAFVPFEKLDRASSKLVFTLRLNNLAAVRQCSSTNLPFAGTSESMSFLISPREALSPPGTASLNDDGLWKAIDAHLEYFVDGTLKKTPTFSIIRTLVPDVGEANPRITLLTYEPAIGIVHVNVSIGVSGLRINSIQLIDDQNKIIADRMFANTPQQEKIILAYALKAGSTMAGNYTIRIKTVTNAVFDSPQYGVNVLAAPQQIPLRLIAGYPKIYVDDQKSISIQGNHYYLAQNKDLKIEAREVTGKNLVAKLIIEYANPAQDDPGYIKLDPLPVDINSGIVTVPCKYLPDGIYRLQFNGVNNEVKSIADITLEKNTRIVVQDLAVNISTDTMVFDFGVDQLLLKNDRIYLKDAGSINSTPAKETSEKYYKSTFMLTQLTPTNATAAIEFYLNEHKFFNFVVTVKSKAVVETTLARIINEVKKSDDLGVPKKYEKLKGDVIQLMNTNQLVASISTPGASQSTLDDVSNNLADNIIATAKRAKAANLSDVTAIKTSQPFVDTLKKIGTTALKIFGAVLL